MIQIIKQLVHGNEKKNCIISIIIWKVFVRIIFL